MNRPGFVVASNVGMPWSLPSPSFKSSLRTYQTKIPKRRISQSILLELTNSSFSRITSIFLLLTISNQQKSNFIFSQRVTLANMNCLASRKNVYNWFSRFPVWATTILYRRVTAADEIVCCTFWPFILFCTRDYSSVFFLHYLFPLRMMQKTYIITYVRIERG